MSKDSFERREAEGKPIGITEGRDGEGFKNGGADSDTVVVQVLVC